MIRCEGLQGTVFQGDFGDFLARISRPRSSVGKCERMSWPCLGAPVVGSSDEFGREFPTHHTIK